MTNMSELCPALQCVDCGSRSLEIEELHIHCSACNRQYEYIDGSLADMTPSTPLPEPPIYDDPDHRLHREYYESNPQVAYYGETSGILHTVLDRTRRGMLRFARRAAMGDGLTVDLGCGGGAYLGQAVDRPAVVGVDMSRSSLLLAQKRHKGNIFIQADATKLPFIDASVTQMFSGHMLEHVYCLDEALQEARRVLKPGGHFYVGLPTEGGLL